MRLVKEVRIGEILTMTVIAVGVVGWATRVELGLTKNAEACESLQRTTEEIADTLNETSMRLQEIQLWAAQHQAKEEVLDPRMKAGNAVTGGR